MRMVAENTGMTPSPNGNRGFWFLAWTARILALAAAAFTGLLVVAAFAVRQAVTLLPSTDPAPAF
jgi:hypothetical protein